MSWFGHRAGSIVLGRTRHPLPYPRLALSPQDQQQHATIWGRTGSGKSKLLQSLFLQHLNHGHGVGLIEPHHDLSFDIVSSLAAQGFFRDETAFERLVYLDWGNGSFVPFNVLAGDGDPHTRALNALEAMLRVWPELTQAPAFQTLFLSAMLTLIANGLPITALYQLLSDATFRRACLSKVRDPLVQQTFTQYYDQLGRNQLAEAGSTLRRAFLLSFSPVARLTLGQPDNWLNFRRMMDRGTAFIINLGNINDHETRKLLGAMLLVQIEQAALSRTDLPPAARVPCTLLIDEWPAFAAQEQTIATILSQTRKFNLRLYLAAQSLAQVGSQRLTGALENCRLLIAFGLGRDSAAIQARHIGQVDPFLIKEAGLTDTQHAQYLSLGEQFECWTSTLQTLSPRQAFVKRHDQPAERITTLTVPSPRVDPRALSEVLERYRQRYQRSRTEAEAAVIRLAIPTTAAGSRGSEPAYTRLFRGSDDDGTDAVN